MKNKLRTIILTLGCFPLPFLETLVIYMYASEISSRLSIKSPSAPEIFLIGLFVVFLFFNIFAYIKYSKKRFEIIYLVALIVGFPMICFCCYLLFYYFPFVHTPQGMGTVIQVYFFIAFVFLIFLLRKLITLIISKIKK